MERRRKRASENRLTSQERADLERLVVQLLDIADRCANATVQGELMELADALVRLIEA